MSQGFLSQFEDKIVVLLNEAPPNMSSRGRGSFTMDRISFIGVPEVCNRGNEALAAYGAVPIEHLSRYDQCALNFGKNWQRKVCEDGRRLTENRRPRFVTQPKNCDNR